MREFDFRFHHLLIIGILAISFSLTFMIRSQALDYGLELNEFDPFFNYRATKFIVENGIEEYTNWHDDMSWYPTGRDVAKTSQVMLHITAASLYSVFGAGSDLYEFTIFFPVVFGSLTAIVVFALVRVIGGTTAGLFAVMLYSVSVPVIVRGTIGWFKSEPLGLFYGLLGLYLFLSGIKTESKKISFLKLVGGGIFLGFGLASWGGVQFFIIPLIFFFFALPFFKNQNKFLIWTIPLFVSSLLLTSLLFERPGIDFVKGIQGLVLIGSTAILVATTFIMRVSKQQKTRNGLVFLFGIFIVGTITLSVVSSSGSIDLPSFRYLNSVNPFLTTQDPLVDSVAEHASTTLPQSFFFFSILMVFAGLGIWLIFRSRERLEEYSVKIRPEMIIFSLILGLTSVYITSAFIRLELFGSIAIIVLASIGLSIVTKDIFKSKPTPSKKVSKSQKPLTKLSFATIVIILLLIPIMFPTNGNWVSAVKTPPTLLNGGSTFAIATDDWPKAMEWLRTQTPTDSVVFSWWDYGYWITTLGERISLADNATIHTNRIQNIAKILLSDPDRAWQLMKEMNVDYVLIYVTARALPVEEPLYLLTGGGDESKKQWFIRIAEEPLTRYLHDDGFSGTNHFWDNTLLGKIIPFSPLAYVNFANNLQSEEFRPGYTGIYTKDIKFPEGGNGPFQLVYHSPSYQTQPSGVINGVFIYKLNDDYTPSNKDTVAPTPTSANEMATITTKFGDIKIQFRPDVAPNTVENFKKLAKSGLYDGTIFHRIIPEFVIQGGDPNTIVGTRDTWGKGGPGYSIEPEFSDLKHKKYVVSMARGASVNSAGSQFFIMLGDVPYLDGQYTIFGEVVSGQEVVDKIGQLPTNDKDQPEDPLDAIMEKVTIT